MLANTGAAARAQQTVADAAEVARLEEQLRELDRQDRAASRGGRGGRSRRADRDVAGEIEAEVAAIERRMAAERQGADPAMRAWLGDRVVNRMGREGFTVVNRKFENTVAVSRTDVEDDQYGIYAPMIGDMGQTAAELPDDLVWEVLASGFDTVGHDGQYFFDTDHPVEDENGVDQSVSNFGGGAGTPWFLIDTSRMIRPIISQDRTPAEITPKTALSDDNVFFLDELSGAPGVAVRPPSAPGSWPTARSRR